MSAMTPPAALKTADEPEPVPRNSTQYDHIPRAGLIKMLLDHDAALQEAGKDGIVMSYTGRTAPWQIIRLVKPKLSRIVKKLSVGDEQLQAENEIWDGENLSAMVTLYKYRGQIDLILTDPPYNTGEDFRYNDKWDKDPNDPDLGDLVSKDDGSRHSKWLRFMTPRLWMMREMLRPGGVIAICIDHRELFRLGMLMDEIFHEENRLAVINWQKATSKNEATHVSFTTEYVLVYAKSASAATSGQVERSSLANARFANPDKDELGDWKQGDLTGKGYRKTADYKIQSPFTGEFHPPGNRHWANKRAQMKSWLEDWGVDYEDVDLKDPRGLVLAIKGWGKANTKEKRDALIKAAAAKAAKRLKQGNWPYLYWGMDGRQKPVCKQHKSLVKQGAVPTTFWLDEDEGPAQLDAVSWLRSMSGRSRDGVEELNQIVGKGHGFDTVKPLKLFKKIIQIWCRPNGIVFDPFAGSGTTAHAVLELNRDTGSTRRFALIEQGNTAKGDHFAKTLTSDRIRRVITGEWAAGKREPLPGGFRFMELKRERIDAEAVNALAREEMIDLLLTSYWDKAERAKSYLRRLPAGKHKYLFAVSPKSEGFFLVWQAADKPSVLSRDVFKEIVSESQAAGLNARYHVYASIAPYTGAGIEFYKIPDKVLEHIGFNPRSDAFNNEENAVA